MLGDEHRDDDLDLAPIIHESAGGPTTLSLYDLWRRSCEKKMSGSAYAETMTLHGREPSRYPYGVCPCHDANTREIEETILIGIVSVRKEWSGGREIRIDSEMIS